MKQEKWKKSFTWQKNEAKILGCHEYQNNIWELYNVNAYLCKIANLLHLLGIFFKT